MTKSELCEHLSEITGTLNKKEAELIVNTIFDSIRDALAAGERVEIRGFGSFSIRERDARMARNPKTGESVSIDGKKVPFFKTGKELKELVDQ
jgi:integration host factor subunit beta